MFDGIDDDGVGVPASEVAGVHEVGHEPVLVFFSEVGIEAAFWVFNVVAEFECGPDIAEEGAAGGEGEKTRRREDWKGGRREGGRMEEWKEWEGTGRGRMGWLEEKIV